MTTKIERHVLILKTYICCNINSPSTTAICCRTTTAAMYLTTFTDILLLLLLFQSVGFLLIVRLRVLCSNRHSIQTRRLCAEYTIIIVIVLLLTIFVVVFVVVSWLSGVGDDCDEDRTNGGEMFTDTRLRWKRNQQIRRTARYNRHPLLSLFPYPFDLLTLIPPPMLYPISLAVT